MMGWDLLVKSEKSQQAVVRLLRVALSAGNHFVPTNQRAVFSKLPLFPPIGEHEKSNSESEEGSETGT